MNYLTKYIDMLKGVKDHDWMDRDMCPRAKCACLAILTDNRTVVWGFNQHLGERECVIENNHCVSAIHAEIDMICSAACVGNALNNSTVISLERPCQNCLKALDSAGVYEVLYINDYHTKAHGDEFCSPRLMQKLNVRQV